MAEKKIKVSVIVATYNQEKYIAHTLESIVSQKVNFDIEAIVGDDCSKDNTAAVVLEYASKYPDIFIPVIRDKNLGMSGNTNDLLMRSKGEYIAMVEGDDYWIDEYKLQKQVDFLDSHSDYTACFGFCQIVDENENRNTEQEKISGFMKRGGEYTIKDFQEYVLPGQTASSMYRKSAFIETQKKLAAANFDMSNFIDRHLVLLVLSAGRIHNLGEYVSAYRFVMKAGAGSWSSENDYYSFKNLMNYLEGMKDLEDAAEILGLELDFDGRRIYEWDKLLNNLDKFNKSDATRIKKKLLSDCNDKAKLNRFRLKRFLKNKKRFLLGKR